MKKHLIEGVKKNAFSSEVAEQKFESWLKDKESLLQTQKDEVNQDKEAVKKQRLEAEAKVKEERAQAISKKLAAEKAAEEKAANPKSAEVAAEQVAETPAEDTAPAVE
jgi:small subunit ribosomal protein S16